MNKQSLGQTASDHSNSPDAVTGDDHEVMVLVKCQNFDVRHCRNHLFLWRQSLVSLIEVVTWESCADILGCRFKLKKKTYY